MALALSLSRTPNRRSYRRAVKRRRLCHVADAEMSRRLDSLARAYFDAWNAHTAEAVGALFANEGTLRDWEIHANGRDDVIRANQRIFTSAPAIRVQILNLFVDETKGGVACEIIVHVDSDIKLKARRCARLRACKCSWLHSKFFFPDVPQVLDLIEFNSDGLITSLRAYKG